MKNKRNIRKLFSVLVLAAAVCLGSCGGTAGGRSSGSSASAEAAAAAEGNASAIPQETQLQILQANRDLWAFQDPYESPWFYTFTDLDGNGRLEVIAATTQGSGIFTYATFYEVRVDGSGIDNLYHADVEIEGPDDWPEIVQESMACWYDAANNLYYYPCEGMTRDGYAHQYYAWQALCLKDGVAEWELIASKNVDWDENGQDTTVCRDAQGNSITEQDYDSAVERRFAGMQQMELKLNWTQVEIPFEGEPVETAFTASAGEQTAEAANRQDSQNTAVTQSDALSMYSDIIGKYKTAFETGNNKNAEYAWDNELSEMMAYSSAVGYALEDLDGNGIPELIIAGMGTEDFSNDNVYELWTLENGEAVPVAISYARMRYYLQQDRSIRYEGSSGAAYTNIVVNRLNGSSLETVEMIFTTEGTNPDGSADTICYYQQGDSERIPSEKSVVISAEEFGTRWEQMEANNYLPPLTKIAGEA